MHFLEIGRSGRTRTDIHGLGNRSVFRYTTDRTKKILPFDRFELSPLWKISFPKRSPILSYPGKNSRLGWTRTSDLRHVKATF